VDRAREQRHEPEAQQRAAALARRREVRENLRTKDPRAASDAGARARASWRVGPAAGQEGRTSMQAGYSRASGASASPPPAASGISTSSPTLESRMARARAPLRERSASARQSAPLAALPPSTLPSIPARHASPPCARGRGTRV